MGERSAAGGRPIRITLTLADNALAQVVFGAGDVNLDRLESTLGLRVARMGNAVTIEGGEKQTSAARAALESLYEDARHGADIGFAEVDAAVRMLPGDPASLVGDVDFDDLTIRTRKKSIVPRTPNQATYIRFMRDGVLTFGLGPAGTGKTYLAVCMAVSLKLAGIVERIVLSRPAVEAGERLGFLPGDMKEKVSPYLRPLYDGLYDCLAGETVNRALETGEIEVAPLAFMRGRTLGDAFVILDEAQNATATQMKMFLTRLGEGGRMVVTGDLSQVDLPAGGATSGLRDALEALEGVKGVNVLSFDPRDVLRHDLVGRIVSAYDARDRRKCAPSPPRRDSASDDE